MDVAEILQGLGYMVCSTMSPNFFAFGLSILVFEISAQHYTTAACYYGTKTFVVRPYPELA